DRMYMLYTAWDLNVAQIAMASIPVQAFLDRRFNKWKRHGLGFPHLANKDAVLYPEKFDGHYVIYHRLDPNMWISYLEDLTCPWPRTGQKIITGPRAGMMWDGVKVGAGAPPIKTKYGWLNIYHGVDYERTYRLGVLLMALDDPSEVIYQSPNPILQPDTEYEIGKTQGRDYWVPHVVFTCGAVALGNGEAMGLDDELLVYYGAADTSIGVAKATLSDLVPSLRDATGEIE
ncbi:MAG: glycosidase, partial [Candidatus Krumholzibacteria bacterium]|nr:glycosidase [Candidatus Krumholzibacteria bacterium]